MTSSLSLLGLIMLVFVVTAIECRTVPDTDTLMPLMLDSMGNPLMILRDKRGHPTRTMMFTGFYRPPRRSGSSSQATSIYAEGNAIGGGAYFSQPVHLGDGPNPVDDDDTEDASNSVAEAHPSAEDDESREAPIKPQDHEGEEDEKKPIDKPSKGQKKGKHLPMPEENDEEDEYDNEDDEDYHKPSRPKDRKYRPTNNYFPMVFSFPGSSGRRAAATAGSGLSASGPITAVANSYSTSKGGVASSVATAYGGSSTKKPRRRYSSYVN